MKWLTYGAVSVLVLMASIPSNSAIARGRPGFIKEQRLQSSEKPQTSQLEPTPTPTAKTTQAPVGGVEQTSNSDKKGSCNQYPLYTGNGTGSSPAPANGTRGPIITPECQSK